MTATAEKTERSRFTLLEHQHENSLLNFSQDRVYFDLACLRIVFTTTRWSLKLLCLVIDFSQVLHKRSLFPSQLALIEYKNIFTLFHDTNYSFCLERTERQNYLTPF